MKRRFRKGDLRTRYRFKFDMKTKRATYFTSKVEWFSGKKWFPADGKSGRPNFTCKIPA